MKAKGLRLIKRVGIAGVMCFFIAAGFARNTDVIDDIASCIKAGDTKELSKFFSSTVSMTLLSDDGVYSRVQAEIILRDFFNRNTPTGVTISHRLDSNPNFRYVVLNLETAKDVFRVSYKLTNNDNTFRITEFRIEPIY